MTIESVRAVRTNAANLVFVKEDPRLVSASLDKLAANAGNKRD